MSKAQTLINGKLPKTATFPYSLEQLSKTRLIVIKLYSTPWRAHAHVPHVHA